MLCAPSLLAPSTRRLRHGKGENEYESPKSPDSCFVLHWERNVRNSGTGIYGLSFPTYSEPTNLRFIPCCAMLFCFSTRCFSHSANMLFLLRDTFTRNGVKLGQKDERTKNQVGSSAPIFSRICIDERTISWNSSDGLYVPQDRIWRFLTSRRNLLEASIRVRVFSRLSRYLLHSILIETDTGTSQIPFLAKPHHGKIVPTILMVFMSRFGGSACGYWELCGSSRWK